MSGSYACCRNVWAECCMTVRLAQERAPNNAVVAQSVVALVTRQGNPKSIQDWHDLTRSALICCMTIRMLSLSQLPSK